MSASQGELCQRVIEGSWKPTVGGVTFTTVRSKLTLVSIILGMAGITVLGGRLHVGDTSIVGVASYTIQCGMFPG